ncbi:hypothetical protein HY478_02010 [Candidatus Uhrbacteria bacterium]|nr:hypothetical protein [Candidatus Uhrbacteria bacterium]
MIVLQAIRLIACLVAGIWLTFTLIPQGIVPYPAPPSEWRPTQTKAVNRACRAGSYDRSAGGMPTPGWLAQSGGEGLRCAGTGVGNVAGAGGRLL